MIDMALKEMKLDNLDIIIIENIGNLVCPAEFDTGAVKNAMILSVPEGDDKPLKYPAMFRNASVLLINKIDLVPYVNCNLAALKSNALQINPHLQVFETSCTTNAGIAEWCGWLKGKGARQP